MKLNETRACELLGLKAPSTFKEARKAYRKLARDHHPDVGGDEERFKELSAAYQWLCERYEASGEGGAEGADKARRNSDPPEWEERRQRAQQQAAWSAWRDRARAARAERDDRRDDRRDEQRGEQRAYNTSTEEPKRPPRSSSSSSGSTASQTEAEVVEVEVIPSLNDKLRAWSEETGQRLKTGLNKLYKRTARGLFEAGRDVTLKLNIDLPTLLEGKQQRIAVSRLVACPQCQVERQVERQVSSDEVGEVSEVSAAEDAEGCLVCLGEARVSQREELSVYVPPGADEGHKLKVSGKGRAGLKGNPPGDLYLQLIPPELPKGCKRRGATLTLELGVPTATLKRGGQVQARTPRGALSIQIPPHSHSGKQLKVKGQGLPAWGKQHAEGGALVGDLIITLRAR